MVTKNASPYRISWTRLMRKWKLDGYDMAFCRMCRTRTKIIVHVRLLCETDIVVDHLNQLIRRMNRTLKLRRTVEISTLHDLKLLSQRKERYMILKYGLAVAAIDVRRLSPVTAIVMSETWMANDDSVSMRGCYEWRRKSFASFDMERRRFRRGTFSSFLYCRGKTVGYICTVCSPSLQCGNPFHPWITILRHLRVR